MADSDSGSGSGSLEKPVEVDVRADVAPYQPGAKRRTLANGFEAIRQLRIAVGEPVFELVSSTADGELRHIWASTEEAAEQVLSRDAHKWVKGPGTGPPFHSIVDLHVVGLEGMLHAKMRR